MRVLFAYDGSDAAAQACDWIAATPWPDGTTIHLVTVFQAYLPVATMPGEILDPEVAEQLYAAAVEDADETVRRGVSRLEPSGLTVQAEHFQGRPATVVLEIARETSPDLIVVGTRGHGPFSSALLGSVSSEIVDHAECPVLVTRGGSLDRVLLAEDGSPSAKAAAELLTAWPIFRTSQVRVVSVADIMNRQVIRAEPLWPGVDPALIEQLQQQELDQTSNLANETARRLTAGGVTAEVEIRSDEPARGVIEAATEWDAGLILMGTRGHSGLQRLLLGSVARKVLNHAPCSVLLVRSDATPS